MAGTPTKGSDVPYDPSKTYLGMELTPKQTEVMEWVAKGKGNNEIAQIIGVSEQAVNSRLHCIYLKLGVPNRTAAVLVYNDVLPARKPVKP